MATETTRVSSYFRAEGYYDSAGTIFSYTNTRLNSAMADTSGLTGSSTAAYLNQVFSALCASVVATQLNNIFSGLASTVTAGLITSYVARAVTADAAATAATAAAATTALAATYAVSASTAANATTAATAAAATTALAATYAVSASTAANATTAATAAAATTALAAVSASTAARATTANAAASASYAASAGTLSGVTATAAQINTLLYGTKYKVYVGSAIATNGTIATTVTAMGIATALFVIVTPQVSSVVVGALATQTGIQWSVVGVTAGTATQATCDFILFGNA